MNEEVHPNILISGYYGFNNAGDEAILLAMLKNLAICLPQAEYTVLSGNPKVTELTYDVKSVHCFDSIGVLSSLRRCDVFISGGGSLLQDVTSVRSLLYYLGLIRFAKFLGKAVMLYAQGVGPINNAYMKRLTGKAVSMVDSITVRDEESKLFLQELGVDETKIQVTADAVFMLPRTDLEDGRILLKRFGLHPDQPVLGVAIRSWQADKYLGALADALDILADQGRQILIIPFQYPADMVVAKRLQGALRHSAKILDRLCSTEEMLSVIGSLKMLIGMRLHSLIFSAVMGVPFVALDYDPKVEGFVKTVDAASAGDVNTVTVKKILTGMQEAREKKIDLSRLQALAEKNNQLLSALVERSVSSC